MYQSAEARMYGKNIRKVCAYVRERVFERICDSLSMRMH